MNRGLGVAVDTEPPTIRINYPDYDVVIRDWFYVVGECFDDKLIDTVKVWITNTRNETIAGGPFLATLSKKNINSERDARTWYVLLNEEKNGGGYGYNKKWTYPDGNYIVKAIAYDKAGRESGEASHTYIIDNTPPFMVLKSPGISAENSIPAIGTGGKTPTPYGANFKIEGTLVENNNVRKMLVDIYQTAGKPEIDAENLISVLTEPLSFQNINTAGSTSEVIATARLPNLSGKTEDEIALAQKLANNYKLIYGGDPSSKDGTEERYCKLTLIDDAKQYQDIKGTSATDETGNTTNYVYINDTISAALMTEASGYNLLPGQIAKILNDTYQLESKEGTNFTKVQKDFIKEKAATALSNLTAFSINPDANPKFNVSGYSVSDDRTYLEGKTQEEIKNAMDKIIPVATASQALNITVSAGRDKYYVRPESLKYYLFGPYDCGSSTKAEIEFVYNEIAKIYEDPAAYYADANNAGYVVADDAGVDRTDPDAEGFYNERQNSGYNSSTVESYNWGVKLPAVISAGKIYVVAVTGKDEENLDVCHQDGTYFIFMGSTNVVPPKITFSETNGATYGKTDLNFTGTARSSTGKPIEEVYWHATLKNDSGEVVAESPVAGTPVGSKTNILPNSAEINWTLNLKNDWSAYSGFAALNEDGKTYSLDVAVWAKDEDSISSTISKSFIIDTTKPIFSNGDFGIETDGNPNYVGPSNLQYQEGKYTLRGTISDDKSGVLAFYYKVADGLNAAISLPEVTRNANGTALTSAPTIDGWTKVEGTSKVEKVIDDIGDFSEKTIAIFALDKAGNRSDFYKYSIVFDSNIPTATVNPIARYTNSLETVTGSVETKVLKSVVLYNGDSMVAKYEAGSASNTLTVTDNNDGTFSVSKAITPVNGTTYNFKLVATNAAESMGTSEVVTVMYDTSAPLLDGGIKIAGSDYDAEKYNKSESLKISGKIADSEIKYGSGIDYVKFTLTPNGGSPADTTTNPQDDISTIIGGFEKGDNSLSIEIADKAGNKTNLGPYTIKVDLDAPEFSDDIMVNDMPVQSRILTNGNKDLVFTGTVTDDNTIEKVVFKVGTDGEEKEATLTDVTPPPASGVAKTYSVKIEKEKLADGANVIAYVTDKPGNKKTNQQVFTLSVDKKPPEFKITSATSGLNGMDDIKGSTDDDKTLQSIALYYTLDSSNLASTVKTDDANLDGQSGWKKIASFTTIEDANQISEIINWLIEDFNFSVESGVIGSDGTTVNKADGLSAMYILPVVIDEAGNSNAYEIGSDGKYNWKFNGYSYNYTYNNSKNQPVNLTGTTKGAVEFKVDLNADRPVIKFTNLRENKVLRSGTDATIEGELNDDDGTVKMFIVSSTKITPSTIGNYTLTGSGTVGANMEIASGTKADGYYTITGIDGEKTMYNPESGQWKFIPADKNDGNKEMYFYVVDAEGTVFHSGKTTASGATDAEKDEANGLYNPRLQYQGSSKLYNNWNFVGYNSDSHNPEFVSVEAAFSSTPTGTYSGYSAYSATTAFGGKTKRYVNFKVKAKDANGIKKIEIKVTDAAGNELSPKSAFTNSETTNSDEAEWQFGYYDLSDVALSGAVKVIAAATDQSDMYSDNTTTFYCDNSVDLGSFVPQKPLKTETHTGALEISGTALESEGSGIAKVEWLIPKKNENALNVSLDDPLWTEMDVSSLPTWKFNFKGTKDETPSLFEYLNSDYFDITSSTVIFQIRMLFKVTDKLGNVAIYKGDDNNGYTFDYMPDANLPKTEVTYPTYTSFDDGGFSKVGRNIRITGSATGNVKASKVYVQLLLQESEVAGVKKDPTVPTTWSQPTGTLATMIGSENDNLVLKSSGSDFGNKSNFATSGHFYNVDGSWWGIEANGTTSWNLTVNKNSTLNNEYLWIRACAVIDETPDAANRTWICGAWSEPQLVQIDAGTPQVGSSILKLVTYDGAGAITSSNENTVKSYSDYRTENMTYISKNNGNLYLVVSAEDDAGISKIEITKVGGSAEPVTYYELDKQYSCKSGNGDKLIYIKLDTDGDPSGKDDKVSYIINATEGVTATDQKIGSITCTFYVDNKAPELSAIKRNGTNFVQSAVSTDNKIQESNSRFILSGKAKEEGSGIERIFFFFHRNGEKFLDPVWDEKSGWTQAKSKFALTADNEITINSNTLYGKKDVAGRHPISGSTIESNKFKPTNASLVTSDLHIKVGGLIYISGKLWRITEIAADGTVTFDGSTGIVTDTTEAANLKASFIYGQSIDTQSKESLDTDKLSDNVFTVENDDGDFMAESVAGTASSGYDWDATIHSNNVADGPATLEILAFDKAGNISRKTFEVQISNNAPRIAKLHLGTDLDSSGDFAASEFETYNFLAVAGEEKDSYSFNTSTYQTATWSEESERWNKRNSSRKPFTIKNDFAIVPEFVGGNGDIGVVIDYAGGTSAKTGTPEDATSMTFVTPSDGDTVIYNKKGYSIPKGNFTSQGANKAISFTFWDHTEDLVYGSTTQCAFVKVNDLTVYTIDTVNPNVVVNKFFWTNKTYNSISKASNSDETLEGHIEIEDDWKKASGYDSTATTGIKDADPKVSGKIVVRGTAYDDVCLGELKFSFGSLLNVSAATYISASEGWEAKSGEGWSFKVYDAAKPAEFTDENSKNFFGTTEKSTLSYFGQSGHKVAWELTIDTAKALGAGTYAGLDKTLTVVAIDKAGKKSSDRSASETSGDGEMHRPGYKMDVVPYVTKVTTTLSGLTKKEAKKSVYDRTALGHYPVAVKGKDSTITEGETITLDGFNLGGSKTVNAMDLVKVDGTYPLDIKINEVPAINNMNYNDAAGTYDGTIAGSRNYNILSTYAYNRRPNNDNNNLLTDDVYFDVWQFNSEAAIPISGKIEQPHMKINPVNGVVGFAFVNGPLYFSMPGRAIPWGTEDNGDEYKKTSYNYWMASYDFFTSVALAYDDFGYSYSVAAGGDINSSSADKLQFMSDRAEWNAKTDWKWTGSGGRYQSASYQVTKRLESIAQVNNGGTIDFDKQRIKSPSLATSVHGEGAGATTNVYLAYYDAINAEIRFKAGNTADEYLETASDAIKIRDDTPAARREGNIWTLEQTWNHFHDGHRVKLYSDEHGNNEIYTDKEYYIVQAGMNYDEFSITKVQGSTDPDDIVPCSEFPDVVTFRGWYDKYAGFGQLCDYDVSGYPYPYRNEKVQIVASEKISRKPGQYVSIDVIPGTTLNTDVVVMCWYDETNRQLMYSYNDDPLTLRGGDTTATNWSTAEPIFASEEFDKAGEYCQLAVDKNGGIHIAAYDPIGCDLIYAYAPSYNGTFTSYVVDGNGVVGGNITIDVALEDGEISPHIGYYATSAVRPKHARLVTPGTLGDGTVDDEFTGIWECAIVPTSSNVTMQSNQYNKINVAIWKDGETGEIKESVTGTSFVYNEYKDYDSKSYGYCYGNGTKNAVLGYAIKVSASTDAIETAQMR